MASHIAVAASHSAARKEEEESKSNALEPESFDKFSVVYNILNDNPGLVLAPARLEDGNWKKRQNKQNKVLSSFSPFHFVLFCSRWSILLGLPCASQGTQ